MERHRGRLRGILEADRLGSRVGGDHVRQIVEQCLRHLIDGVLGKIGARYQIVRNDCRFHRGRLTLIGIRGDGGGQERRASLGDYRSRDFHDYDLDRVGKILDRSNAEARRLKGGIELTILDEFDGFGERKILDLAEVLVLDAGGGEDRASIQFGAGLRRADREALALKVSERLDAAFLGRDDLNVVRVDRANDAKLVQLRAEAGIGVAGPALRERVAEREGDFALAGLQQVEIFDRSLGRLHGRTRVLDLVRVELGERNAERIVDAGSAASENVDEILRLRRNGRYRESRSDGDYAGEFTSEVHS